MIAVRVADYSKRGEEDLERFEDEDVALIAWDDEDAVGLKQHLGELIGQGVVVADSYQLIDLLKDQNCQMVGDFLLRD